MNDHRKPGPGIAFLLSLAPLVAGAAPAWTVAISVADAAVVEGAAGSAAMRFAVTLSAPAAAPVSVAFATLPCTAAAGLDYDPVSGRLWLDPGEPAGGEITVPIHGDAVPEGDEIFFLLLSDPTGAELGRDRATGLVRDDDRGWPPPRPRGDLDGDGKADLLVWYERTGKSGEPSGKHVFWPLSGLKASPGPESATLGSAGFRVVATADLGDDGTAELIWYRPQEGLVFSSFDQGFAEPDFSAPAALPAGSPPGAVAVGSGDFDADGEPDLMTWDPASRELEVWLLSGPGIAGTARPTPAAGAPGWRPLATGHFDGDASPDLLWVEESTRSHVVWLMDGPALKQEVPLEPSPGAPGWAVVAVGDFDGSGGDDLLWQNAASRRLVLWFLEGSQRVCGGFLDPQTLELDGWVSWEVEGPR